jgi:hypothetical protein
LWLNGNRLKKINNLDSNFRIKSLYAHVSAQQTSWVADMVLLLLIYLGLHPSPLHRTTRFAPLKAACYASSSWKPLTSATTSLGTWTS